MRGVIVIFSLICINAYPQYYGGYKKFFAEHKNDSLSEEQQFFVWVNAKRKARLAPQLNYHPRRQEQVNAIAVAISKKNGYCHCYGIDYGGEIINKNLSLTDAFYSFMMSDGHRKVMMHRSFSKGTVGIYHEGQWYYTVMRLYY